MGSGGFWGPRWGDLRGALDDGLRGPYGTGGFRWVLVRFWWFLVGSGGFW